MLRLGTFMFALMAIQSHAMALTKKPPPPNIISISPMTAAASQTINIQGTGFGNLSPYTGDSDYIHINVCTNKKCTTGWEAGYAPDGNSVGLIVNSWTDTDIMLGGFTNYGGNYVLENAESITIYVYKPQTGQSGPHSHCKTVVGGGSKQCEKIPASFPLLRIK